MGMANGAAARAFPLGACLAIGGGLLVVGAMAEAVGGFGNLVVIVGGTVGVAFVRDVMRGRRGEGPFANTGGEDPAPDPVEVSFEDWYQDWLAGRENHPTEVSFEDWFAGREADRGY